MTRFRSLRSACLLLVGSFLLLQACEKPAQSPTDTAKAEAPDATEAKSADKDKAPKDDKKVDADPAKADSADAKKADKPGQIPGQPPLPKLEGECGTYLERLCKEAGRGSDTCGAASVMLKVAPMSLCKAGLADIGYTVKKLDEAKVKCQELATRICKDLGTETDTCKQVKKVTPDMPPERCVEMVEHYDEVITGLRKQEEANKPLDAKKQAVIAAKDAPSFGPANAAVTIVEFSDFECPYCSQAADVTNKLKEKYPGKVRVVFRQFPLSFHPNAHMASQAALEATKQGKFWEFHDLMFQNQRALTRQDLEKYAGQLKMDMKAFKKALDDKSYAAAVDADMKMGAEVAVQGTPTMFLNGKRVSNPTSIEVVSAMVDEALAAKK